MNESAISPYVVRKDRKKIFWFFNFFVCVDTISATLLAILLIYHNSLAMVLRLIMIFVLFSLLSVGKILFIKITKIKEFLPKYSYMANDILIPTKTHYKRDQSPSFAFCFMICIPLLFYPFIFMGAVFRMNSFLAGNESALDVKKIIKLKLKKRVFSTFNKDLLLPNVNSDPKVRYKNFVTLEEKRDLAIEKWCFRILEFFKISLDLFIILMLGLFITSCSLLIISPNYSVSFSDKSFTQNGNPFLKDIFYKYTPYSAGTSFGCVLGSLFFGLFLPVRTGMHRKLLKYSPWAQKILCNKKIQNYQWNPNIFYIIFAIPFVGLILVMNANHTIKKYERGKIKEFPNLINATYQELPEKPCDKQK